MRFDIQPTRATKGGVMDWPSFALGFVTFGVLWFAVQVGRSAERRDLRRRLLREEGLSETRLGTSGDKL